MSSKQLPVKELDVIEVLPGCPFHGLVYSKGIVRKSLSFMFCVVEFPADKRSKDGNLMETFQGRYWCIPWKYLRVVESAYDDKVCELMEELQSLEDDLMIARSCLVYSEEMREIQYEQIKKLVEDIDLLKAELYHLKFNGN
jgi:hypothetical protein